MKQFRGPREGRRNPARGPKKEKLEAGRKLFDKGLNREGIILDCASQYTHPQAQPIYNYLIRWDDGQVQALSEAALSGSQGIELLD